ncbi:hypothetical protein E1B28_013462 [Marasmius oreades]|uniref:Amidohydrolase-related domain-containing protein n=1 Tax=Marasmius oreades TaxID=181124 RepID=A0A9P7RQP4_9AGAR|nr:uncharacterized protein E1B28_013462 [Marasmius oreades]KAG7087501.1 hypothetical protein E1B28_013462 [Marasmius oreades]
MLKGLAQAAFNFPVIDNHAHPLLKSEYRDKFPFESLISEASGNALTQDAPYTLACFRATAQLAPLLDLDENVTWDDVKARRAEIPYLALCKRFMVSCQIQCLLLDDGLEGVAEYAEGLGWHSHNFGDTRRIVRVEVEAETILKELLTPHLHDFLDTFTQRLGNLLANHAKNPQVAAFKSIVCYRSGLHISPNKPNLDDVSTLLYLQETFMKYQKEGVLRLDNKVLNDIVVHIALNVAGKFNIPVQFHTGLGDNDISLAHSSPALMQPIITAYPCTKFVLLHSSYPYMRDAGYMASVYENVFLDFGEVFPCVSGHGQRSIIQQILELTPTNKLLWSTDGHWFPESFYLGTLQARQALYDVLSEIVAKGELKETQAISVIKDAFFSNSNRLYNLGLNEPEI